MNNLMRVRNKIGGETSFIEFRFLFVLSFSNRVTTICLLYLTREFGEFIDGLTFINLEFSLEIWE